MHLFKKWSKYAFGYASMQMHNYPKPNYNIPGEKYFFRKYVCQKKVSFQKKLF